MDNFKNSTIYQIYTKSYRDSNGDGLGDIQGIIEKLDYLEELGVDYIWMTPFFKSPLKDNGYDVADYTCIDPIFGTMDEVEELIAEAQKRGIGCMFDMVFNHTSTEHKWFQQALKGDTKYMDYYIFREGRPDHPPTNWQSKFGGDAWEYVPHLNKWYLHLFDVSQADLNWDNPKVREELKAVISFWKEKGVRGFRFDVANLVSKPDIFEDDTEGDGRRFYTDGPRVHQYLKELVKDAHIEEMVTVGEMSSTTIENCIRYSKPSNRELSMCFNFHHLKVDYKDGEKWEIKEPDIGELKELFVKWQEGMQAEGGWNAVFWCNHDQPRAVSRFGNDKEYWKESAKMLATCIHMMRGTPYIYQGEELGMTNTYYDNIKQYQDVESRNYYEIMLGQGKSKEKALEILRARSRDNGRTPMQWDGNKYAGFSEVSPWLEIPKNYTHINVEAEREDEDSILNYYRKLIKLRKESVLIGDGEIQFLYKDTPNLLAFKRYNKEGELLVLNNLGSEEIALPEVVSMEDYTLLIGNYKEGKTNILKLLQAYESIVLSRR